MKPLRLKDVHNIASELFWKLEKNGEIFPPAEMCKTDYDCCSYVIGRHASTHHKIEGLLSRMILDSEKPPMTIEEQFFVREHLRFAMFLSECIDTDPDNFDDPYPAILNDVRINIEGTTTNYFLMWLVGFVFFCLGETNLREKAYDLSRLSRERNLTNRRWLLMREDPNLEIA